MPYSHASTALEDKSAYIVVDLYSNHYQRHPLAAVIPTHFMGWTSICNISWKLQNSSKRTANDGICLMVWPFQKAILYLLWQESTDCQLEMLVFDFYGLTLSFGFSHAELTLPSVEPCLFRPIENMAIYLSKYINKNQASQEEPLHLCMCL